MRNACFLGNLSSTALLPCIKQIQINQTQWENTKKNGNDDINKKGIDAFKCDVCGLWSTGKKCNNKDCTNSS